MVEIWTGPEASEVEEASVVWRIPAALPKLLWNAGTISSVAALERSNVTNGHILLDFRSFVAPRMRWCVRRDSRYVLLLLVAVVPFQPCQHGVEFGIVAGLARRTWFNRGATRAMGAPAPGGGPPRALTWGAWLVTAAAATRDLVNMLSRGCLGPSL